MRENKKAVEKFFGPGTDELVALIVETRNELVHHGDTGPPVESISKAKDACVFILEMALMGEAGFTSEERAALAAHCQAYRRTLNYAG